ncbi:MAG: serine/threonine-protein kinase [Myxococcota bacterium]
MTGDASSVSGVDPLNEGDRTTTDGTERLLGWNTIGAVVGLVLSIAILALTVWFSSQLKKQAELLSPASQMAALVDADISRSIAALRGYLAYGDPRFIEERRRIWVDIERSYEDFEAIARPQLPPVQQDNLTLFRARLNQLKHVQWAIEDVAHTPGNEPARRNYEAQIHPIRTSILQTFRQSIGAVRAEFANDAELSFRLVVFHAQFMTMDTTLADYVQDPTALHLQDFEQQALELDRSMDALEATLAGGEDRAPAVNALATYAIAETRAYLAQARTLTWEQQHRSNTVAQELFRYRAQPLADFVSERMRLISTLQAETSARSSKLFQVIGLVVVFGALLIGAMSLSTLYVSFRIRSRVSRVIDRAKRLGQYKIERKLGAGGMGEVYLARHALLRRPAAIKLLRSDRTASRRAKRRFRAEVQLTSRLTHPNTVEIFDYGVTPDNVLYYAMEYLDGPTLQQVVDLTGPMPSGRVIHILRQVAGSLQEAHDLGLLHRDIKPSNIMLCRLGGIADSAKVLDFGLVLDLHHEEDHDSDVGQLEGTPLYLAPETILESNGSEERSDLYALGAVGYFLLCGHPPFEGGDIVELLCQHLSDAPVPPSEQTAQAIDPDLEQLILDCLEKDPEDRPRTALAFQEALDACEARGTWGRAEWETWWAEFGEVVLRASSEGDSLDTSLQDGLAVRVESRSG